MSSPPKGQEEEETAKRGQGKEDTRASLPCAYVHAPSKPVFIYPTLLTHVGGDVLPHLCHVVVAAL